MHSIRLDGFGRLGSSFRKDNYYEYLISRVEHSNIDPKIKTQIEKLINIHQTELTKQESVLCNMDTGPDNLIFVDGKLILVDFEHASGCTKEWDVVRACSLLPDDISRKLNSYYYSDSIENKNISLVTKAVMLSTFASNLEDGEYKNNILNKVKRIIYS